MNQVNVLLVYNSDIGRPLTAASVTDPDIVLSVATRAIGRAYAEARAVLELDPFVGRVKRDEAERLHKVLVMLVPELENLKELETSWELKE